MKQLILKLVIPLALAIASTNSWAILIVGGPSSGNDVGVLDTLLGQQSHRGPGGNPAGEESWAESILGIDLTFNGKDETVAIYDTDTANIRAFALSFSPGYFVLKNATHRALFANLGSSDWAVVDTSLMNSGFNLNGTTISHVTQFNGNTGPGPNSTQGSVPLPSTIFLLGMGLMALRVSRRSA